MYGKRTCHLNGYFWLAEHYCAVRNASMTMEKDKCVCFIDGDFKTFHLLNINLPCISKVCV